jgi:hypothetical protein
MLTTIWNPPGSQLISVLGKGRKFNVRHYVTEILSPLSEWGASDAPESGRKLTLHAYSARLHTPKDSQLNSLRIIR